MFANYYSECVNVFPYSCTQNFTMADGMLSLSWNNHKATFCHILSTLREKVGLLLNNLFEHYQQGGIIYVVDNVHKIQLSDSVNRLR